LVPGTSTIVSTSPPDIPEKEDNLYFEEDDN
jgi:hypothetical protein